MRSEEATSTNGSSSGGDRTRPSLLLRLGDRTDCVSWQEFHDCYGTLLYRFARARGVSHVDAEDIAQEVEAQFLRALDGFVYDPDKGRFRSYLWTAVVHAVQRRNRREQRQPAPIDPRTFDRVAGTDEAWDREWRLNELRRAVRELGPTVDPVTRQAFELHVLAAQPVAETAEALGISIWRVYRARDRMLEHVREWLRRSDPGLF